MEHRQQQRLSMHNNKPNIAAEHAGAAALKLPFDMAFQTKAQLNVTALAFVLLILQVMVVWSLQPTWVGLCSCFEAGNKVDRNFRVDPVLGNPGGKVDSVQQVAVVCGHDIAQVFALQTAGPPCGNERVNLST